MKIDEQTNFAHPFTRTTSATRREDVLNHSTVGLNGSANVLAVMMMICMPSRAPYHTKNRYETSGCYYFLILWHLVFHYHRIQENDENERGYLRLVLTWARMIFVCLELRRLSMAHFTANGLFLPLLTATTVTQLFSCRSCKETSNVMISSFLSIEIKRFWLNLERYESK